MPGDMAKRMRQTLRHTFGHARLRPAQGAVIERVMTGRSALAIMPTGAGKSLCYQLPAALLPGITLVVSPLIALMKDQCDRLHALGLHAVQLHSQCDAAQREQAEAAIDTGEAKVVFCTPERLADEVFVRQLANGAAGGVSLLVVDEAHCVASWGHDFRPAYLDIAAALPALGRPPVLALTATASEPVRDEILQRLSIPRAGVVNSGMYRANLRYAVESFATEAERQARALALVAGWDGPGIVYTATVRAAEQLQAALLAGGVEAGLYHGRLDREARGRAQENFMGGAPRVMVATNAFGMGIDKADVRFVLHVQMPASLEAYYQESGRAGRDGAHALCMLLHQRRDRALQQFFITPHKGDLPALRALQSVLRDHAVKAPMPASEAQARTRLGKGALRTLSLLLHRAGLAERGRDGALRWRGEAPWDDDGLRRLLDTHRRRVALDREGLERMSAYALGGGCRWHALLDAFGHAEELAGAKGCGHCDNCARIAAAQHAAASRAPLPTPGLDGIALGNVSLQPDSWVRVARYGRGRVVSADAQAVTVAFADGAQRSFLRDHVRPVKVRRARRGARGAKEERHGEVDHVAVAQVPAAGAGDQVRPAPG